MPAQPAILLLDGGVVAAEERAREECRIAAGTDFTRPGSGRCQVLADVLGAAGRPDDAREVVEEAIVLAREKESVAHERLLRAKLAELAAQPPATA